MADNFAIQAYGKEQIISDNLVLYPESGITCSDNTIITNNTIKYCKHTGIALNANNVQIRGNVIIGTYCTKNEGWWGQAALYLENSSNLLVENNYFDATEKAFSKFHSIFLSNCNDVISNNNIYKNYDSIKIGKGLILVNTLNK